MRTTTSIIRTCGGLAVVGAFVATLSAALPARETLPLAQSPASAQTPRDQLLVTPAWLAAHLNDPDLVLLHVGEADEYRTAHIPGARLVDMEDVSTGHSEDGRMLQTLPPDVLRERLQALGISDGSRIVVYYGDDWVSPSTRIIFALDHAGLGARTSLLDGGMQAWRQAGNAVTDRVPAARRGRLSALRTRDIVVDAAWVQRNLRTPGIAVVDGRAAVFYDGVQATHNARNGHIPGARSIPFTSITDDRLRVRSAAELAALFRDAGIRPGDTIVGYCHIGQQATAVLFAARTLGYNVKLYDGSFEEWGGRAELPVENPRARGGRER
ncbi:MAG TPA: rhodanese-like domain-containing protein [Longimicrobium sp.]|nr:rhodanese-like domain-containing protein [Longimicrobium sp.]